MDLVCKVCGAEFKRSGKQALKAVCCSTKCLGEYNKAVPKYTCTNCEKKFHMKLSQFKRHTRTMGVFCSSTCTNEFKKTWFKGDNNHQKGLKGPLNASFKNMINEKANHKLTDLLIYVGDTHPFANECGRVLYHRFLVEENFDKFDPKFFIEVGGKKYLSKMFEVHHKDGNHSNNNISNLQPMSKSEHRSLHNKEKEIVRDEKGRIKAIRKIIMKEITVTFYVSTKYLGSEVEETITIEVPEDANEALIDKIVSEYFETWVWENIEATYEIK